MKKLTRNELQALARSINRQVDADTRKTNEAIFNKAKKAFYKTALGKAIKLVESKDLGPSKYTLNRHFEKTVKYEPTVSTKDIEELIILAQLQLACEPRTKHGYTLQTLRATVIKELKNKNA